MRTSPETGAILSKPRSTGSRALLLAANLRLQYRVLRCAADVFDEVYVLGSEGAAFLSTSSFCHGFYAAAEGLLADPPAAIATINDLSEKLGITHLIPTDFDSTRFLALAKDSIRPICYPVATPAALDTLNHKGRFAALCQDLSISHPDTWVVEGKQELIDLVARGEIAFPIVTKPACSEGGFNVRVFTGPEELSAVPIDYTPVIVQKYIEGSDLCAALYCHNGVVVASVTYVHDSDSIEFVPDPGALQMVRGLVEHLHYNGVLCFDIRKTPSGALYFVECNPRFWYHLDHTRLAGLNFVQLGVEAVSLSGLAPLTVPPQVILKSRGILRIISSPWTLQRRDWLSVTYLSDDLAFFVRTRMHWWRRKLPRVGLPGVKGAEESPQQLLLNREVLSYNTTPKPPSL